jgi:D-alanyl-D-alanine carboxypeptidase (penicillin-binding protein 5/6)
VRWRVAALLLAALPVVAPRAADAPPPVDAFPQVAAAAYVVAVDDRVLWARAADTPRAPASLAKLLIALVLLGNDWDPDAVVTVSPAAAAATGTRLGVKAGERFRASELLTGLLVGSANDACYALVEHQAGSRAAFVAQLDTAATLLRLQATRIVNPCGLDAPGQQATASDLLRLARAAMDQPEIARRVALPEARVTAVGGRWWAVRNTNRLIGLLPGVAGVKSGYTRGAGKCVVAALDHAGHRVWLVLLDAPDRWRSATGLLQAALDAVDPNA